MSALRIRAALRRRRSRVAAVVVVLTFASALAAHHGMPQGMDHMPAAGVCLAILAIAAVAGIVVRRSARPPWPRAQRIWAPHRSQPLTPRSVPARAGPLLVTFSVIRR